MPLFDHFINLQDKFSSHDFLADSQFVLCRSPLCMKPSLSAFVPMALVGHSYLLSILPRSVCAGDVGLLLPLLPPPPHQNPQQQHQEQPECPPDESHSER